MKTNLVSTILNIIRKFRPIHLHWSAIDLAAGAMICQWAFSRLPTGKSSVPLPVILVLGLTVFIISSINRLLDNRKPAKTEMKRFLPNQKNRITFLEVIAGGLVTAIFTCFYLPGNLWKYVSGLAVLSGLLVWLTSRLSEKNVLHAIRVPVSAILFTAGVLTGVIFSEDEISKEIKYTGVLFFMVVFQNFLLSAYYQAIEYNKISNLAGYLKALRAKQMLHIITFLVVTGSIGICLKTEFRYTQRLAVILMLMSFLQSVMLLNTHFMQQNKYKGMLIVLVFTIPFLIL